MSMWHLLVNVLTDEGGFLEFPFKCNTLSEKTGLACRVPFGWLIDQCMRRAMKDYVTAILGCMEMADVWRVILRLSRISHCIRHDACT